MCIDSSRQSAPCGLLPGSLSFDAVIVLVGNKTDLVEDREVSEAEGKELADR